MSVFCYSSHLCYLIFFFFFNDTATTEIYTLSLHDALPISFRALSSSSSHSGSISSGTGCARPSTLARASEGRNDRQGGAPWTLRRSDACCGCSGPGSVVATSSGRRLWGRRARSPRPAPCGPRARRRRARSEEHTSELQSRLHLVCRLLLEKKKNTPSGIAGTGCIRRTML